MQSGLIPQPTGGFLGVNLRRDRLSLADGEMATAINADLHTQPGVIMLRKGRSNLQTGLTDQLVRRLARINSVRYQVAGNSLYRAGTSILSSLSANLITTLTPFRPFNDTTIWAFVADDAVMRKDNGTNLRQWGIDAPTVTPLLSTTGTGLTGTYKVRYTYVRLVSGAVAAESNPSPASANQALTNQSLSVSNLGTPGDAQVTHIRLYRTAANGSQYFYDQDIAVGTTTATSSQADTALGAELETDNDLPPRASWCEEWNGHLWLARDAANPHYLWRSKRFKPEQFPPTNYLEVGEPDDPLQCLARRTGLLGVLSRKTKFRIVGNSDQGYVPVEGVSRRGTPAPNAMVNSEWGTIFVANDGIFVTDFLGLDQELSQMIFPLFDGKTVNDFAPVNFDAPAAMSMAVYKNRLYFSYPSGSATQATILAVYSKDTQKWYFYDHPLRSLYFEEDTQQLTAGGVTGSVFVLEDGSDDAGSSIALDCQTRDYFGADEHRDAYKLFHYLKVDADTGGSSVTVKLYVDDTLKRTTTVATSSRTETLIILAEGTMGYRWRVRFEYTGTTTVKLYGAAALYLPLAVA